MNLYLIRVTYNALPAFCAPSIGRMIKKRAYDEWLVEPDIPGAREYARLAIIAMPEGLNIDGQGLITWNALRHAMWQAQRREEDTDASR